MPPSTFTQSTSDLDGVNNIRGNVQMKTEEQIKQRIEELQDLKKNSKFKISRLQALYAIEELKKVLE